MTINWRFRDAGKEEADEWDCEECDEGRRYARNCDNKGFPGYLRFYGSSVFRQCPISLISPFSLHLFRVISLSVELNKLPSSGGILDQETIYLEALEIFLLERQKIEGMKDGFKHSLEAGRQNSDGGRG